MLAFILPLVLMSDSCKKEPISICGITNPQENLQWLKSDLLNILSADIYKLNFNGEEFIIISDKDLVYDGVAIVYDCKGQKLCEDGGYNPGGNPCNLSDPKKFWDAYNGKRILLFKLRD